MLSESQAWEKMARAFYKPPSERGVIEEELASSGMCYAIARLWWDERISVATTNKMRTDLEETKNCDYHWCVVCNRESDFLRADFCMLQSYMTEKGD